MLVATAVHLEGEGERLAGAPERGGEHAREREHAVARLARRVVHEARVQAERDVVQERAPADLGHVDAPLRASEGRQRGERVIAVEADVAGEVVARAEGNRHEGDVELGRDRCDRAE